MPRIDQLSDDAMNFMADYKSPLIWQIIKKIADQQDEVARGNQEEVTTGDVPPMDFCNYCYEELGFTDMCANPPYEDMSHSCLSCGDRLTEEDNGDV